MLAKDLQLLFLWEFADSLHNSMIQNLGLGKRRIIVVTGSQHNLGVTWCWSDKIRVVRASLTQQVFSSNICPVYKL